MAGKLSLRDEGMIYYFSGFPTKYCKYYLAMFSTCHVEPVVLHWQAGLQVIVSCPPSSDHKLFPPTFSSLVTISLSPYSLFCPTIETIFVQPQCPIYHSLLSPRRSFLSHFATTVRNSICDNFILLHMTYDKRVSSSRSPMKEKEQFFFFLLLKLKSDNLLAYSAHKKTAHSSFSGFYDKTLLP